MVTDTHRPAWVEIDLEAIAHNMRELRRLAQPGTKLMAVVKADGYGHGAVPVSQTALANGADYLGVAIYDEARQLRQAGIGAPILILGFNPPELAGLAVELDVAQTVYSLAGAKAVSEASVKLLKTARIHIKVDTGMGRLGYPVEQKSIDEVVEISKLPNIFIEGMFTHFAVADTASKEFTYQQYSLFREMNTRLRERGVEIPIIHAANSAALIDMPDVHLDMARTGIALYGLYPSDEVRRERITLVPAMRFKALVAQVKRVPAGSSISYGRTYTTTEDADIAVVPVGYADGYTRLLTNKAHVLVRGKRVPVIGRICMDQFMIDVSSVPDVKPGDEVVLLGRQDGREITADELAGMLGTINYEIVCMISHRVPRIYAGP